MKLTMKAIANSIEPKGVEPGLFPRAVRPVAGFGFEQLFAITNIVVSDDVPALDASVPPELATQAQALAMIAPIQIDVAKLPADFAWIAAQMEHALSGQDGAAQPMPWTALAEGAVPSTGDAVVHAPQIGTLAPQAQAEGSDAALAVPGAAQNLTKDAALGAVVAAKNGAMAGALPPQAALAGAAPAVADGAAAPLKADLMVASPSQLAPGTVDARLAVSAPDQSQAEVNIPASLPYASKRVLPLDDAAPPPLHSRDALPPRTAPDPLFDLPAPKVRLSDAGQEQLPPELLVKSPVKPSALPAEKAAPALDPDPAIVASHATKSAQTALASVAVQLANVSPRDGQPATQHLPKFVVDPAAGVKVDGAFASGATAPEPAGAAMNAPGAVQLAKVSARDAQPTVQTKPKATSEQAVRGDGGRFDPAQAALPRPEAQLANGAISRAPVTVSAPAPVVPAPIPMAGILNMRQADWGQQLVGQIERMAASGSQRVEISLRPKNLGEIQVSLDLRGDQTHVHIVTETAAAARLLGGSEDRLAQMLDQAGYRLSGFSAQEHGTGSQQGQTEQQGQQAPRRNRPAMDTTLRDDPSDASAAGSYSADRGKSSGINMLA